MKGARRQGMYTEWERVAGVDRGDIEDLAGLSFQREVCSEQGQECLQGMNGCHRQQAQKVSQSTMQHALNTNSSSSRGSMQSKRDILLWSEEVTHLCDGHLGDEVDIQLLP